MLFYSNPISRRCLKSQQILRSNAGGERPYVRASCALSHSGHFRAVTPSWATTDGAGGCCGRQTPTRSPIRRPPPIGRILLSPKSRLEHQIKTFPPPIGRTGRASEPSGTPLAVSIRRRDGSPRDQTTGYCGSRDAGPEDAAPDRPSQRRSRRSRTRGNPDRASADSSQQGSPKDGRMPPLECKIKLCVRTTADKRGDIMPGHWREDERTWSRRTGRKRGRPRARG